MFKAVYCLVPALLAVSGVAAEACSPIPPPVPPAPNFSETQEEYQKRLDAFWLEVKHKEAVNFARSEGYANGYEEALWDSAAVIALVEVVEPKSNGLTPMPWNGPQATFKVVKAIKGKPSRGTFNIGYEGMTSCGPYGHVSMAQGSLGERFVVFSSSRKLEMKTILEGYNRSEARNYRTKELLQEPSSTAEGK